MFYTVCHNLDTIRPYSRLTFLSYYLKTIPRRLVRYNVNNNYGQYLVKIPSHTVKPLKYSCEKCDNMFSAWKYLYTHKVECHSY